VIAAGIALVAVVAIVIVGMTVDAMGWKGAAATWGFAVLMTGLLVAGVLLIEAGLTS
jgi:hypothetical protein